MIASPDLVKAIAGVAECSNEVADAEAARLRERLNGT
jgi:hypothetical protein